MKRLSASGPAFVASFHGEHRFLSNFWPADIVFEGVRYASVEHAYQAAKCVDAAEKAMVRTADSPGKAKRLARKVKLRADWESVKVGLMREFVRLKFATHADLAAMLLSTGHAELVEGNTWNDTFWGVCRGVGKNWLGRILMEVREELRQSGAGGEARGESGEAETESGISANPATAVDVLPVGSPSLAT